MSQPQGFRFRIRPAGAEWSWATVDLQGRVRRQGSAPSRAAAAACVICAIARDSEPPVLAEAA